jgi:hypothetical protein
MDGYSEEKPCIINEYELSYIPESVTVFSLDEEKVTKEKSRKERLQPVPFILPRLSCTATVTSAFEH